MKIKEGYMLRNIAGTHIVVPVAERVIEFRGMMVLNYVSAKVWEFLSQERTYDETVDFMLSQFETDRDTVKEDLDALLKQMEEAGVLA